MAGGGSAVVSRDYGTIYMSQLCCQINCMSLSFFLFSRRQTVVWTKAIMELQSVGGLRHHAEEEGI